MNAIFTFVLVAIGLALVGTTIIWVLQQRRSPQSALAWILFILTLPYVGVPLFFALGVRKRGARYMPLSFRTSQPIPPLHPVEDHLRRLDVPAATSANSMAIDADAAQARKSLERLIGEAETSLEIALYRLDPDAYSREFVGWLTKAARRGVEVRLILDQFGTLRRPQKALKRLHKAGGQIEMFSPIARLAATGRLNLRNHRKLLIADGARLWTGGRNVGATYLGPPAAHGTWTDLSLVIEGPVVARYREVFEADWAKETNSAPRAIADVPDVPDAQGGAALQLVPSGPDMVHDALHDALVHAIHRAERRVWIATPYFLPTDQLQHALITAARLGRDVRLMLPARSNQWFADFARGAYVRHLEEAGCRVLRYGAGQGGRMLHAKAAVIDDMVLAGSANFDVRSMLLNFETALAVYDPASVARLADWFTAQEAACTPGTVPATLPRRVAEAVFRLGAPIL